MLELILLASLAFMPHNLAASAEAAIANGAFDVRVSEGMLRLYDHARANAAIGTIPLLDGVHERLDRLLGEFAMIVMWKKGQSIGAPIRVLLMPSMTATAADAIDALNATLPKAYRDVRLDAINAYSSTAVKLRGKVVHAMNRDLDRELIGSLIGSLVGSLWLSMMTRPHLCI
jgi:hypothetical protein